MSWFSWQSIFLKPGKAIFFVILLVYIADAGPLATLPFDKKYIKALKAVHHNRCKVAFHTAKKTISSTNMLCNDKKKKVKDKPYQRLPFT